MTRVIAIIIFGIIRLIYARYKIKTYATDLVKEFDTNPPLLDTETGIWTIDILRVDKSPLRFHMHLINNNPIDKTKMHPTSLEMQFEIDTKKTVKNNLEEFRKIALLSIKSISKM